MLWLWALRLTPNGFFCCWEFRKTKIFTTSHQAFVCWILSSVPARPSLTAPVMGQAPRSAHSRRGQQADPASHLPFPLLQSHPSHPSRIRMGGSTLAGKASQAWLKCDRFICHTVCYLGCSSPALECHLPLAGIPGGGLRSWSSHRLDSGPPPTLTGCGTVNTLLTVLHTSGPYLWRWCYLSYWVARRIKWVNMLHLNF